VKDINGGKEKKKYPQLEKRGCQSKMVNLRTETIRCILCNHEIDYSSQKKEELYICAECQAYFCQKCREAVRGYESCPAARLLGVKEHKLKFIKLLPPKVLLSQMNGATVPVSREEKTNQKARVKILSEPSVKIIDKDDNNKKSSSKGKARKKNTKRQ